MEAQEPSKIDKLFNKVIGLIAGSKFAPGDLYLLVFYGRKTGSRYTTPVFMMEKDGSNYLVAPRGETQWVKNVRKSNSLFLKREKNENEYKVKEIPGPENPVLLKEYFNKYKSTVTSFFPKGIGDNLTEFEKISENTQYLKLNEPF